MSLVLCTTKTTTTPAANGPVGPNDNNNNTDNTSEDSNPLTIYRYTKNQQGEVKVKDYKTKTIVKNIVTYI